MDVITSPAVFVVMTVMIFGVAATLTGQALADTWRPARYLPFYIALLGAVDRFLQYALFNGELLSVAAYIADSIVLLVIGALAYRLRLVSKMVTQYPWRFERMGLLRWRPIDS